MARDAAARRDDDRLAVGAPRRGQDALALALACSLAACGGSAPPPAAPKQTAVDDNKAQKGARDLVGEIHESIGHGDTDGLMTLLAEPLIVLGPRRGDAMATRSDALVALKTLIDPKAKKKPGVKITELDVVASPGGRSAWATDLLDFGGAPLAITAVLSNNDDIWLVNVVAVAQTPAMRNVRAELKQDAVVPPAMAGMKKQDDGAKLAVDKLTRGLAAQQVWGDDLATRTDSVVIGPAAGDVTRGKTAIKAMWKKRVKANVREALVGDVTSATTPDGELAWVTAPVVRFEDNDDPLPLRVFAIFEKNGADWRMIALHESLAFDAPGSGAALKKTAAPPKPEEPKPATPPATKKTPAKKKKRSS